MMANSAAALIGLVQWGVLELHTWGARRDSLDKPDRLIFDLDPAPGVPWKQVVEAAQLVRRLMEEIGLTSFVKTTGGKGLHVVIPLRPEKPWDDIKTFARAVAEHLERTYPQHFTAKMTEKPNAPEKSLSIICATPRKPLRSPPIRPGPAPALRYRRRSDGMNWDRTCIPTASP